MTEAGRPEFLGRRVPGMFRVHRIAISPGAERASTAGEWHGALVVLEHGAVEVIDEAGGRRAFGPGDLLCLEWVGCERIVNIGAEEALLLAIHRPERRTAAATDISLTARSAGRCDSRRH